MFNKHFISNLVYAFGSQFISLTLSLIMSLIVPKFIGITEFGYWQLFIFYSSYIPFLQFGLNDGIYLINGGKSKKQLDLNSIKSQFIIGVVFETVMALIMIGITLSIDELNVDRKFILIQTAINFVIFCAANYLGYIFQAINDTKTFSISIILNRVSFIIFLFAMVLSRYNNYYFIIVGYNVAQVISLVYCIYKGRYIFQAKFLTSSRTLKDILETTNVGIKLMLANIASMLILGISRYLVDWNWGINEFSEFSFAITLTNFFLMFINQFSMVMFPSLKVMNMKGQKKYYSLIDDILTIALPVVFLCYFPAKLFLNMWLPQYENSIYFFGIALPLCTLNGKMSILYNTFFKVRREEKSLLIINLITLLISGTTSLLSVFYFDSIELLLMSIVLSMLIRNLISDYYLKKVLIINNFSAIIDSLFIFVYIYSISIFNNDEFSFIFVLCVYCVYILFNFKKIKIAMMKLNSKGNNK